MAIKKNKKAGAKKKTAVKKEMESKESPLYTNATEPLMPELEELVKKNPNRLLGCGG
jgi:hypothetical protein